MQLKTLAYLIFFNVALVVARGATSQDIVASFSKVTMKAAVVQRELDAMHNGTSIVSLLTRINLDSLTNGIRDIKNVLEAVPGPLSPEECAEVIDTFYQMQPVITANLKALVDKKYVIDNLGFGRVTAIVGLTLIDLKRINDEIQDALLAVAPDDCLHEVLPLLEQVNAVYNTSLAVYA
ncbi:hypothetical protein D9756_008961 [Leucocoprinus leucothites]|uniref:Uncharacterized protein n=1 Tax=Leucocoprinus leucothites TaxID=201217 RepID=A0A8H5CXE4_9AGAR|nr:hypothetical protein D9756_008961 [Leucoagaricus leucothites]